MPSLYRNRIVLYTLITSIFIAVLIYKSGYHNLLVLFGTVLGLVLVVFVFPVLGIPSRNYGYTPLVYFWPEDPKQQMQIIKNEYIGGVIIVFLCVLIFFIAKYYADAGILTPESVQFLFQP